MRYEADIVRTKAQQDIIDKQLANAVWTDETPSEEESADCRFIFTYNALYCSFFIDCFSQTLTVSLDNFMTAAIDLNEVPASFANIKRLVHLGINCNKLTEAEIGGLCYAIDKLSDIIGITLTNFREYDI